MYDEVLTIVQLLTWLELKLCEDETSLILQPGIGKIHEPGAINVP